MESIFVISTYRGQAPFTRMSIIGDMLRDERAREPLISFFEQFTGVPRDQIRDSVQIGTIPMSMVIDVPLHHLIDDTGGAFSEADMQQLLDKLNAAR